VAALLALLATYPMEMLIALSLAWLATIPFAIRDFNARTAADEAARKAAEAAKADEQGEVAPTTGPNA
jgi:CDP-diacylglycerol--serine O-phosphatidyltransferase